MSRRFPAFVRPATRWSLCLAALLVLLYVARQPLLTGACQWLDVSEPPSRADYVLILPGGEQERPFVAAALVKTGWASKALIPQNRASPVVQDGLVPPTHEVIRRVLLHRGLCETQIEMLDSASSSTWEDAAALGKFLQSRPAATVLVVTHHHHTRRSQWVFHRMLGRDASRLLFVAAPTDDFSAANWWRFKGGIHAVLGEYLKFGYYLFRYGDLRVWSVVIGVFLLVAIHILFRRRQASTELSPAETASALENSRT